MNLDIIITIAVFQAILFGVLTHYLAIEKGRNSITGFALGFFLGFLGFLYMGFLPIKGVEQDKKELDAE
jgi:hypothetical protein